MAKLWSRASSDNRDAIYIYHSSSGLELCMILLTGERWLAGASMFFRLSQVHSVIFGSLGVRVLACDGLEDGQAATERDGGSHLLMFDLLVVVLN